MKIRKIAPLLAVAICVSLTGCGSSTDSADNASAVQEDAGAEKEDIERASAETSEQDEENQDESQKLDLTGSWEQSGKNPESYQAGYIKDGVIEIYWMSDTDDTAMLYWSGTYEESGDGEDSYSWDSKNNTEKTSGALMASSDETKTFNYENWIISYQASAMGETTTIKLEKADKDYTYLSSEESDGSVNADSESFSDNVLVADDYTITITDYKIIQPGDTGNEYGEKPVIAFWYDTTNTSDSDDIDASSAWISSFEAVQDNDPNRINELEIASLPDEQFLDSQMEKIKSGGTVSNAEAYELDDLETPVTLIATDILGAEYGRQNFEIK